MVCWLLVDEDSLSRTSSYVETLHAYDGPQGGADPCKIFREGAKTALTRFLSCNTQVCFLYRPREYTLNIPRDLLVLDGIKNTLVCYNLKKNNDK